MGTTWAGRGEGATAGTGAGFAFERSLSRSRLAPRRRCRVVFGTVWMAGGEGGAAAIGAGVCSSRAPCVECTVAGVAAGATASARSESDPGDAG